MAYSRQDAVSDGTLQVLDVAIQYMRRADIFVLLDDVLTTDWAWVGVLNSIAFPDPIPNGVTVTVVRRTRQDKVIHEFAKGALFNSTTMDTDFRQMLYLAQEYSEGSGASDFFTDVNLHGFKIRNLGRAVLPGDAVPYSQYQEDLGNVPLIDAKAQAALDASGLAVDTANAANSAVVQLIARTALVVQNVAAAKLVADPTATAIRTLGYYAAGDRGGALYFIEKSSVATPDGGSVHAMANGWRMVLVAEGPIPNRVFGAKGDGVTDDYLPLQAWANFLLSTSYLNQTAGYWQRGRYRITQPVKFETEDFLPNMYTDGPGNVRLLAQGVGGVLFSPSAGSGQNIGVKWEGIAIEGTGSNYGTRNDGLCYFSLYNWHFYNVSIGMWAVNMKSGGFAEGWQGHGCYFHTNVQTWLEYDRVAGTNSCRGTGLVDVRGNCGPSSTPVVIRSGVVPYSAPFWGHIWVYNPNAVIITNYSTQVPMDGGAINIESQIGPTAKATMGGGPGSFVFHQGELTGWGFDKGNLKMGKFLRVQEYANVDGVGQLFIPAPMSEAIPGTVVGGNFTIPITMGVESPYLEPSATLTVGVRASGLYWQGVYLVTPGATANVMNAARLTDTFLVNSIGAGAAVVAQGTMYNVMVSIPNCPVGAVLTYTLTYNHALLPR